VEFKVSCGVSIELDLLSEIEKQARQRGVSVEALVNMRLQQKIVEQTH
jgi:hypothetical protein